MEKRDKPAAECGRIVLQVLAILCLAGICRIIPHRGYPELPSTGS